ncbi:MAG TPA: hypothetical protein VH044_19885 [Polyangiaceae bacterium]|jgi:hypothetical protein|nr:hypothetical protein [Polyangiaceae bacterium]
MRFFPFMVLSVGAALAACSGGSPASPTAQGVGSVTSDASSSGDAGSSDAGDPFAACGTIPTTGTIPADVTAVLTARCQTCHTDPPVNGAPFPLLTYAQIHSDFVPGVPKYEEMYMLIQPDGDPHMPFGDAPQLSTDQFDTLASWLKACAPPG